MKKTKKINGGVRLSGSYDGSKEYALSNFLKNSTFRFISNSTISCFTVLAVLNRGEKSNFKSCRSNDLDSDVRSLFVKIMLLDNSSDEVSWHRIPSREYEGIEISCPRIFNRECQIQNALYKDTLLSKDSFMDAICPCIVGTGELTATNGNDWTLPGLSSDEQSQLNKITRAVNSRIKLKYIAMEMMDGFIPAKNIFQRLANGKPNISTKRDKFLQSLIEFEFERLNDKGYCHGDAHLGNVMINPTYPYLSNRSEELGKAIIIDFGRTRRLTETEKINKANGKVENGIRYVFPIERFHVENHVKVILTLDRSASYLQARKLFTNSIKPILFSFIQGFYRRMYNKDLPENVTVDNVIDVIKMIIEDTRIIREGRPSVSQLFFEGGTDFLAFKTNPQSVRRVYSKNDFGDMDMEKMDMEKMDMEKMDIEKMDMEKNVEYDEETEIFELHNTDWSEFLKPIQNQLKTMDFKKFINILQEEYNNKFSNNVVLSINKKSINKKSRNLKLKKTKTKKTNQKMQKTNFSINPRIISTPIYTI
jgi:hypothetical protein